MVELDYTQMQTFCTCPMKYHLKFNLGLKKVVEDEREIDKNFGQYAHRFLEKLYKDELFKIDEVWADFKNLEGEKHKTKANGIQLCSEYALHYDKDFEVLGVEINDTFPIGNVTYRVKIDTVIKKLGNIYILEHKTAKKIPYNYFSNFSPNFQVSGYSLYVKMRYGQCSGCIVNVLQSGWRERAYRGEPAGFHSKFQREIVNRSAEQLDDFRYHVQEWADMMEFCRTRNLYLKNEGSCGQYRGCTYKELCLTSCKGELDSGIVESMYEKKDPREYLKK